MSQLPKLLLVLLGAGGAVAVERLWPTPRRQAIARVQELGGAYSEERAGYRTLGVVDFTDRPITDDDLVVLQNIRPLHRILLDGTRVTDAGLARLEGLATLEWVSVSRTAVTDEGLTRLGRIPTLTAIHARRTSVSDAGLVPLRGLAGLGLLNVAETRVTADGIDALRRAAPGLRAVVHPSDE